MIFKKKRFQEIREFVFDFFKKHNVATVNLVITCNFVLFFLHVIGFAEYKTIGDTTFTDWSKNNLWHYIFLLTALWLLLFRKPPKAIWGLWVSLTTFSIFGGLLLYVGLTASNPVSLLGPTLLLLICAPLAWISVEEMSEEVLVIEKKNYETR